MIEWTDAAIVLSARHHGEGSAIVQLLTATRGRHAGLARGGSSSRQRGTYQPGTEVAAVWRARLADQLGNLTCEAVHGHAAGWLDDAFRLAGIGAACAVAESALPEREPHPPLYHGMAAFLACLDSEVWPAAYVRWEIELLAELGYGLGLDACAVTGTTEDLAWVSPRSGRAVSREAGEPYATKLLPLPGFLVGGGDLADEDVIAGLDLTGYFLRRHVFAPADRDLPQARLRLADMYARRVHRAETADTPDPDGPGAQTPEPEGSP
ncbi:DNA repair protein RecO (recombination protein O) [Constrictibacter sp. MBR-5]|jgi:DNA repair protein RecO (recombination protein O)|uniref:DNA repair protein RecO n=1 Tax=Constrictibacter sp. MBR-5 TaxID=3156467 RepID=UPI0033978EBB